MSVRLQSPSPDLLPSYRAMRRETIDACAEKYILPKDPNDPPPPGFVRSHWYWAVRDGSVVGVVNIRPIITDAMHTWGGNVGYAVRKPLWGQGLGREIFRLAIGKARQAHGIAHPIVTVDARNLASAKIVARAAGSYSGATLEILDGSDGMPPKVFRYVF